MADVRVPYRGELTEAQFAELRAASTDGTVGRSGSEAWIRTAASRETVEAIVAGPVTKVMLERLDAVEASAETARLVR